MEILDRDHDKSGIYLIVENHKKDHFKIYLDGSVCEGELMDILNNKIKSIIYIQPERLNPEDHSADARKVICDSLTNANN